MSTVVVAQDKPQANSTAEAKPTAPGTSIISGLVIYEDTGAPANRFRIMLVSDEVLAKPQGPHRFPTAITNEKGEFALRQVPAGDYFVTAASIDDHSPRQDYPYPHPTGDAAADAARLKQFKEKNEKISVGGQNRELHLRVPNPHFGVISGRVLDSSRKPAVRALVRLISKNDKVTGWSRSTDENGQYKFYGLKPGDYTICASPPAKESGDEKDRPPRFEGLLGVTYFPSTLEVGDSPPITVVADRTTENIDVTLIERKLYSIDGTIATRGDKRPVSNAVIRLKPKNASDSAYAKSVYISSTDKDGHWLIANLIDGDYHLYIEPRQSEPDKPRFVQEELDVTINGADVQGLSIEVSEGSRISGVVEFEGGQPQEVSINAIRFQPHGSSFTNVTGSGPFSLSSVPAGEVQLSASAIPQERFYVKSIEVNGQDLLRTDLKVVEGTEIKDIRLVVSSAVGVVTGRILSNSDQPVPGINVMLRRVTEDKLRLFSGRLVSTTDNNGAFLLSGAPGVYLVVAWRTTDSPEAKAAAFEKAKREQSGGITLTANEKREIEIRLP